MYQRKRSRRSRYRVSRFRFLPRLEPLGCYKLPKRHLRDDKTTLITYADNDHLTEPVERGESSQRFVTRYKVPWQRVTHRLEKSSYTFYKQ